MNDNREIDILLDWWASYVTGGHEDPHQEFAERRGTSRTEAKEFCHKLAYKIHRAPVMQGYSK